MTKELRLQNFISDHRVDTTPTQFYQALSKLVDDIERDGFKRGMKQAALVFNAAVSAALND